MSTLIGLQNIRACRRRLTLFDKVSELAGKLMLGRHGDRAVAKFAWHDAIGG